MTLRLQPNSLLRCTITLLAASVFVAGLWGAVDLSCARAARGNEDGASLQIAKSDGLEEVQPGQEITYTLIISYTGNDGYAGSDGSTVWITDVLPVHTTFLSSSHDGIHESGVVTWRLESPASHTEFTATVTVRVTDIIPAEVQWITNTARAAVEGGADEVMAEDCDRVLRPPALRVAKANGVDEVTPGLQITYTIYVTNTSLGPVGVLITDALPAHTAFMTASAGGIHAGGQVTWSVESLAANAEFSSKVTVVVTNAFGADVTAITNTASAQAVESGEVISATDSDRVLAEPRLTITKSNGLEVARPGEQIMYTLNVTNTGGRVAGAVLVTDVLPAHTSFVGASPGAVQASGIVTWTPQLLAAGDSRQLTVTVRVTDSFPAGVEAITNMAGALVWGIEGATPVTATDRDAIDASPQLKISKDDGRAVVRPGDHLTYTLTITNTGNREATGLFISDTLPAHTTFVTVSNGGRLRDASVVWDVASLGAQDTVTHWLTVKLANKLPAGIEAITNTASVANQGGPTVVSPPEVDTVDAAPDLVLSKTDGRTVVQPGDLITYTLTVTNIGNQDATGVIVTDTLPLPTTFIGASDGRLAFNGVVTWTLAGLRVGATKAFTLSVQLRTGLPATMLTLTNTAQVGDDALNGPDLDPKNNIAYDYDKTVERHLLPLASLVRLGEPCFVHGEPNGTLPAAYPLTAMQSMMSSGGLELWSTVCANDADDFYWFRIVGQREVSLIVQLDGLPANLDLDLYLYREADPLALVMKSDAGGPGAPEKVAAWVNVGQKYYLRIHPYPGPPGAGVMFYRLLIRAAPVSTSRQ